MNKMATINMKTTTLSELAHVDIGEIIQELRDRGLEFWGSTKDQFIQRLVDDNLDNEEREKARKKYLREEEKKMKARKSIEKDVPRSATPSRPAATQKEESSLWEALKKNVIGRNSAEDQWKKSLKNPAPSTTSSGLDRTSLAFDSTSNPIPKNTNSNIPKRKPEDSESPRESLFVSPEPEDEYREYQKLAHAVELYRRVFSDIMEEEELKIANAEDKLRGNAEKTKRLRIAERTVKEQRDRLEEELERATRQLRSTQISGHNESQHARAIEKEIEGFEERLGQAEVEINLIYLTLHTIKESDERATLLKKEGKKQVRDANKKLRDNLLALADAKENLSEENQTRLRRKELELRKWGFLT